MPAFCYIVASTSPDPGPASAGCRGPDRSCPVGCIWLRTGIIFCCGHRVEKCQPCGQQAGRLRNFSRVLRAQGNNPWAGAGVAAARGLVRRKREARSEIGRARVTIGRYYPHSHVRLQPRVQPQVVAALGLRRVPFSDAEDTTTASPDSSGRRGQIMAGLGGCEERSVPMSCSSSIGISATMPRRELGVRSQETGDGGAARERSTAAVAAGIRSSELGVGSKGGCGCAKRGAASPDAWLLS